MTKAKTRPKRKNPHAQSLAFKRAKSLTPARRREIAQSGAAARWPRCEECGEREGHSVHHSPITEVGGVIYSHPFEKKVVEKS